MAAIDAGSDAFADLDFVICINPNVSIDHTVVVPRFENGTVMRTGRSTIVAGGKGLNVARALKTLGRRPLAMGMLGGHSGQMVAALAHDEGIEARWVDIDGTCRVCVMVVESDTGVGTVMNETGPTIQAAEWAEFEEAIVEEARGAEAVCLAGSQPPGVPLDAYGTLVRRLRDLGPPVFVDAHSAGLRSAAEAGPHVLKANGDEVGELLGHPVETIEDAANAAVELRAGRSIHVVVTLGKLGAAVAHPGGVVAARAPQVETVSSIGSGDAFLAGYIAARVRGDDAAAALGNGIAAGAANARSPWGAVFDLDDQRELLRAVRFA
jgi:1-phosphofructokinase family hexose kinase